MHENEILVFLLATFVLVILVYYQKQLVQLPAPGWLFAAYASAWLAWLATNLEHIMAAEIFNTIEHVGYALNATLLFVWCWKATKSSEAQRVNQ